MGGRWPGFGGCGGHLPAHEPHPQPHDDQKLTETPRKKSHLWLLKVIIHQQKVFHGRKDMAYAIFYPTPTFHHTFPPLLFSLCYFVHHKWKKCAWKVVAWMKRNVPFQFSTADGTKYRPNNHVNHAWLSLTPVSSHYLFLYCVSLSVFPILDQKVKTAPKSDIFILPASA